MDAAEPGLLTTWEIESSVQNTQNILKVDHQTILEAGMPATTEAKGLDPHRQWYLYEQIRPFCKNNLSADFTCPRASCDKPDRQCNEPTSSAAAAASALQTCPCAKSKVGKKSAHNATK